MIRIGRYSALDKWNILCRHWADPGSVPELAKGKHGQPPLPEWNAYATFGGRQACLSYIRQCAATGLREGASSSIEHELGELSRQVGFETLCATVNNLVDAIIAGGTCPDTALPRHLTERLCEEFKRGAIENMHWTDDCGEVPTLEMIRERAGRGFPTDAIANKKRVLSVFCAAFCGRNDVIYIHDAFPDHVTLVDGNAEYMEDMKLIYPRHWTYIVADYRDYVEHASKNGRRFDAIVADQAEGAPVSDDMAWNFLPKIMEMCSGPYILNYFDLPSCRMFEELGTGPQDLTSLSKAVQVKTGVDIRFSALVPRNRTAYWAVIDKPVRA